MPPLPGQVGLAVSRDELLDRVWGPTYEGGSDVVDVVVRSLRKQQGMYVRFDRRHPGHALPGT